MRQKLRNITQVILLIASVYVFILSINMMGSAFKSLGEGFAEKLITSTSNPLTGLFIGMLVTSVIQSSSCTTSIVVSLVASQTLLLRNAIPIVMGSNIGTSVTNTIVSLGHITRKDEFEKAFSGAIVHDSFNVLSVLLLFPLEVKTHAIERLALAMTSSFRVIGGIVFTSPLKLVIEPVKKPLLNVLLELPHGGVIAIILSLIMLFVSLRQLTRTMRSMVSSKIENLLDEYLFKSPRASFLSGLITTSIIQSSSITTSIVVPLVGAGILSVEKIFPYVLGANIGTTVTAILASLATIEGGGTGVYLGGVTIAYTHLIFNVIGTIIWYPLRFVPINLAKKLSSYVSRQRRMAVAYIIMLFYLLPLMMIFLMGGL